MDNGRSMIHGENFGVGLKLKKENYSFFYDILLSIHIKDTFLFMLQYTCTC